jgi:glucan 1,3-beta-glucosidase
VAVFVVLLLIIIPVGVVLSKKSSNKIQSQATAQSSTPPKSELDGLDPKSIPEADRGTYYDPWSWYDTANFNVTYTKELVGGLPIMGLNSTWNDNVQANSKVPALKDGFAYGSMPVRGMNIGGWLSLEPFITPSFFARYNQKEVIDEYTLCQKLGGSAPSTLEPHYSAFVNFQTFADIRAAGFDHVRIPFSYWAVTTYDGDPYVKQISWRYLLRAIEWARQNGLRVNLDLHGLPGSQNGWNHSGRQGVIGWLNGTDGTLNGQRSLDIHGQLSTFFGQPRYKNIVTMYGLANEPRMTGLDTSLVLDWTTKAVSQIRKNNVSAIIIFGDGFMGLDNWQGKLQMDDRLLLDVHQYVIFNTDLLQMTHSKKLTFACAGWQAQMTRSQNKATGFGPTMCGEWSQADTDCALNLNNVGMGNRWQGTLMTGNTSTEVLQPFCPLKTSSCDCTSANADPSKYSDAYKRWLLDFATAQMESFEYGWGWFYWTWQTENAVQWSWKLGAKAGILPKTVWDRSFSCNSTVPDFAGMGLAENY